MAQISSDLQVVGIKLNTTQPRIVCDVIKMCIMSELSTEDVQFWVLFTPYLVFCLLEITDAASYSISLH